MTRLFGSGRSAAFCLILCLFAAAASGKDLKDRRADPLEPARAALRTLQYDKAIALLQPASIAGNAAAQYLLGLIYLNGVGIPSDAPRAHALLQSAAEHGHGAAAYVLAAELSREPRADPAAVQQWLERSAQLGYARAADALHSGRPLLDREALGASDAGLFNAWVMHSARMNDAAELRRLGDNAARVRDEFERPALAYAVGSGAADAAEALLALGTDPNATDRFGTTALMLAVENPDLRVSELLLQHGADPNVGDSEQRTALFYAARANQAAAIELLLRAGGRLEAQDRRGSDAGSRRWRRPCIA